MSATARRTSASRWLGVAGGLALVATLALTSPGIRIARASDAAEPGGDEALMSIDPALAAQAEGAPAPACRPADQPGDDAAVRYLQAMVKQQIRELELRAAAGERDADRVVLNNRGYAYPRVAPAVAAPE